MKQIYFYLSILLITVSLFFLNCSQPAITKNSDSEDINSKADPEVEATLDSSGEVFDELLIAFESGSNTLGDTDTPRSMSTTKGAFFPSDIFDPDTKTPADYLGVVLATDGEWKKVVNNAAYGSEANTVDVWIGNYANSLYNVKFVEYFNSSPVVVKSVSIYKVACDSWEPLTDIDDKGSVDPAVILANYKSIQETVYYFDGREETRTIEYMPSISAINKYYVYNTTMDNSEWALTNKTDDDQYSVKQSLVMDYPDWISELFMQVNTGVSYYTELAGESFTKEYWYEDYANCLDRIITANEYLISRTVGNITTTKNKIDIYAFKWGSHGDNVATIDENITITTTGDNLTYAGTSVTTIQSDVLSKLYLKSITKTINLTGDISAKEFSGTVAVVKEHKTGTENYTYTLTTGSDGNGRYIETICDLPVYFAWEKKLVNSTVQFKFYFETKQLTGSITLENGNSVTIDGTLYRGKFIGDVDVISSGKGYSGKVLINKFFIQANIASANYNCIPGQDDF